MRMCSCLPMWSVGLSACSLAQIANSFTLHEGGDHYAIIGWTAFGQKIQIVYIVLLLSVFCCREKGWKVANCSQFATSQSHYHSRFKFAPAYRWYDRGFYLIADLKAGYDAVPLTKESRDLTAFHAYTHGSMCLTSLPQGYTNSMSEFSTLIIWFTCFVQTRPMYSSTT